MEWLAGYAIGLLLATFLGLLGISIQRDRYPLRGRHIQALQWMHGCCLGLETIQLARLLMDIPCWLSTLSLGLGVWISLLAIYRAIHFILRNLHASKQANQHEMYLYRRNLFLVLLSEAVALVGIYTVIYVFDDRYQTSRLCDVSFSPLAVILVIWFCLHLLVLFRLSLKLFHLPADGLYLRYELLSTAGCSMAAGVIISVVHLTNLWDQETTGIALVHVLGTVFVVHSSVMPILASFYISYQTEELNSRSESTLSLANILERPESRSQFKDFLDYEFSGENLQFYELLTSWLNLAGNLVEARQIYETFLGIEATQEVNLSSRQRKQIYEALETENHETITTAFTAARNSIFNLMEQDSFRRFQSKQKIIN